mmetsp:Transcript_33791/g.34275  ORF Transcript_33791/g.34275 Transcript_33791/m.34275 type:complete len:87 (+) Transcript_33791:68-328(+)
MINKFNKFRILRRPMAVIKTSPTARPPVPTKVANNPELNVPTAKAEGTHLLINEATNDSQASTPEKAMIEPMMYWIGPTEKNISSL